MEDKVKIQVKLVPEGECYMSYIDGEYFKLFNSFFEGYKNKLDADEYFRKYFKQKGCKKIEITYVDGEYIMEGEV